jgi:hypothetical protein
MSNFQYVNNTNVDLTDFLFFFAEAYRTGELAEDVADIFAINFVEGANEDGTKRLIINWA